MKMPHRFVGGSLSWLAVLVLTACPQRTPPAKNKVFEGSFGERFEYSPKITIDHNPHGGADRATFIHDGEIIGFMFVTPPPGSVTDDILKDVIIQSTKEQFGATLVESSTLTNRSGCILQHYSGDAKHDGRACRYELFLHIDKRKLSSMSQSFIIENFGVHKFEFVIPSERFASVMPLVHAIIDSYTPLEARSDE